MEGGVGQRSLALRREPSAGPGFAPENEHSTAHLDQWLDLLEGKGYPAQSDGVGEPGRAICVVPGPENLDVRASHHPRCFPQKGPAALAGFQEGDGHRRQEHCENQTR